MITYFLKRYFHVRISSRLALERLFHTCLETIQPGEVDEFRQPGVWILLEEHRVARTIRIHLLKEEFPGRIDFDVRKNCMQPYQRDELAEERQPKHAANPIRKNIPNRVANDENIQQLDRLNDINRTSKHEYFPPIGRKRSLDDVPSGHGVCRENLTRPRFRPRLNPIFYDRKFNFYVRKFNGLGAGAGSITSSKFESHGPLD